MRALRHIVVTTLVSACALVPLAGGASTASASVRAVANRSQNTPAGVFSAPADTRGTITATSTASATSAATSTVTISGKGFGHGVGLAQDGDLELGREGKKMPQILGYFYPGTRFGTIGDVTIRAAVVEVDGKKPIDVTLPAGGVVRVGGSGVSVARGGVARLTHDGSGYHVKLLDPPKSARADTTSASGASTYSVYSSGLEEVGGSSYHGVLTVAADGKKLRAIDALPIETYLEGLGEVRDPSWPAASLQALVVAARSYALHSLHPGSLFDVWSDDRSQVYLGAGGAYDALTSAVEKTRGLVLTYNGSVADTVYSASGGGVTATAAEGFGDDASVAANEPYLTAGKYPTANPLPWTVTYSLATVGAALAYPGTLTGLSVTSVGPSGRATGVTLTGSGGPVVVPGLALYHDLRLQSNLYALSAVAATDAPTAAIPTTTTVQSTPAQTGTAGAATPTVGAAGAGAGSDAGAGTDTAAGTAGDPAGPADATVTGAAAPHVVTTGASSAALPTPSPAVAVPAANDLPAAIDDPSSTSGVPAPDTAGASSGASTTNGPTTPSRELGSASTSGVSALTQRLAVGSWALAAIAFGVGIIVRRRRRRPVLLGG